MSKPFKDITGQKFGKLTALYRLHNYHKNGTYWLCICECGNLPDVNNANLVSKNTSSCGCTKGNYKHKKTDHRLFWIFHDMKQRCYNQNSKAYKDYGGRGIAICKEWLYNFENFYNWAMEHGYNDNLTIDRINVNGNYEPSNCRWVDRKTQQRNRRNCKYYNVKGKTHCLKEWCDILNLNYNTVQARLKYGWTIEKALFTITEK